MPRWINLPNGFTALRVALVPFVVLAILHGSHAQALALFAIAGFTDFLDGAAARRFGTTTQAGAFFDPIADKCLLSGVFLALAAARSAPWWLVAVIFGRDLYILLGAAAAMRFTPMRKFPPSVWGKISTLVQMATAVSLMARDLFGAGLAARIASVTPWPCATFTVWSGLHYTWRTWRPQRPIDATGARE